MFQSIFFNLYYLAHQNSFLDKVFVFGAKYLVVVLVLVVIWFGLKAHFGDFDPLKPLSVLKKRIIFLFDTIGLALFSWLLADFLKGIIKSPRPFILFEETVVPLFKHGALDSFPSGHASFLGALTLSVFLWNRKAGYGTLIVSLLIMASRVISGVHFPEDMIAGFILGVLIIFVYQSFFGQKTK